MTSFFTNRKFATNVPQSQWGVKYRSQPLVNAQNDSMSLIMPVINGIDLQEINVKKGSQVKTSMTAVQRGHVKKIFVSFPRLLNNISFPRHKILFRRHYYLVPTT